MKANMLYKQLCDLLVAGENLAELDLLVYDQNVEEMFDTKEQLTLHEGQLCLVLYPYPIQVGAQA